MIDHHLNIHYALPSNGAMGLDQLGLTVFRHRNVDQFRFQAPGAYAFLASSSGDHVSGDDDDGGDGAGS